MTELSRKSGRGGRREGAGRPRGDSKMYTFRVPGDIARHIEAQPNKTDFIKSCIIKSIERQADFSKLGEVISPSDIKGMTLPFFDIDIAAGFPIPLDNEAYWSNCRLQKG